MSGRIKKHKYIPPSSPNRKSDNDSWSDSSETPPPTKKTKKLENVNHLRLAESLGMGNSCFGFTHSLAEGELRLEEENLECDERSKSNDSEKNESEEGEIHETTDDKSAEKPEESASDDEDQRTQLSSSLESDDRSSSVSDDRSKSDSQSEESSSEDEEIKKLRSLLEAKIKEKDDAKLAKKKMKKQKAKKPIGSPTLVPDSSDGEQHHKKTRKENQDQSDLDGLASCSSDDELERQQKRKARARNKKDEFDAKNRQDLEDDDTEFHVETGIAVEKSKKTGKIRIHDGTSSLSQKSDTRDDHSSASSDSLIAPSENGDTPTRVKKSSTSKKQVRDDQPILRSKIAEYFEIYGVPDPKPDCPMPECKGQQYHDRSGLIRHLKHQHKVSKKYLDELKETIPTSKEKNRCKLCGWVGLKTNRPAHLEVHIRKDEKRKEKAAYEARQELQANLQITGFDEGPIPNKKDSVETQISNFLTWMEVFMEKNRNKKNTYATYKLHMQRMLKIWIDKKCLSSVYALWNLHDTDLIPVCDPYVDKIDSDTTKEQACNAYKKICDFVERELGKQPTSGENLVRNRGDKLTALMSHRNLAHAKFKSIRGSAKANPVFIAERQERLAVVEENKIIEKYRLSDQRKYYGMNSENWLNLSKEDSYGYSFAKVRDFLILELLLFGGGNRMDSILNMTVEDFLNRNPSGDGYQIVVKTHKTEKKDAVNIYLQKSTYNMMNTFYQGIRSEMNFKATFYGQTFFCTVDGGHLRRCDDAMNILNKFIQDNDLGNIRLTPNDTRFLFSNWGEEHTDDEIRRNVAEAQNHSMATHKRHYNYAMMERKKKLTLKYLEEKGGGETDQLDVEANQDYEMRTSQQIEELRKKNQLEKKEKAKKVLKEQDRYTRHNLKPSERKMMIRLLYNPNEEGIATRITVPVSDVLKLTEENEEFREMFLRVAGQLEPKKTPSQMARTMKESYKSYWRKKIAKKQPLVLSDEENDDEEECDDQSGSKKN